MSLKGARSELILVFKVIVQSPKICLGGCMTTSKTKINVFVNISSLHFRDLPLEKISKNVQFILRGKQYFLLPKWTFFRVLAHCALFTYYYVLILCLQEFCEFRAKCGLLWCYDWVSIPMVYTQVVTLATYVFFIFTVIGRQKIDMAPNETSMRHEPTFLPII